MWRRGIYHQVLITSNLESQHTCFTSSPYSSAAVTPTKWQLAPATRVTLLLPGKECERDEKCQKSNMSLPASPNHSTQTKKRTRSQGCLSLALVRLFMLTRGVMFSKLAFYLKKIHTVTHWVSCSSKLVVLLVDLRAPFVLILKLWQAGKHSFLSEQETATISEDCFRWARESFNKVRQLQQKETVTKCTQVKDCHTTDQRLLRYMPRINSNCSEKGGHFIPMSRLWFPFTPDRRTWMKSVLHP